MGNDLHDAWYRISARKTAAASILGMTQLQDKEISLSTPQQTPCPWKPQQTTATHQGPSPCGHSLRHFWSWHTNPAARARLLQEGREETGQLLLRGWSSASPWKKAAPGVWAILQIHWSHQTHAAGGSEWARSSGAGGRGQLQGPIV